MDCDKALGLMSALIDHEIEPADRARLDAHLNQCPACRTAAEGFQSQHADLRRGFAPRREAVAATAQRVIAGLRAASAGVHRGIGRFPRIVRFMQDRRRLALAGSAVAALVMVAVGIHLLQRKPGSSRPAEVAATGTAVNSSPAAPDALTARPRAEAPAPAPLALGQSVQTRAGERRRVSLPDGSILYINENTELQLSAQRHVKLYAGEVFLEVAPRPATNDGSTFLIQTPNREIVALGTKFAVRAEKAGTGIVVTQGKVKISGLDMVVKAGQQVVPGSTEPRPAPRASYVLDWTRDLMVAAESPLVPASEHGGGALVALDPWGQEAKLSLRKYHVDVHIEDGFARTTIDQTYFNHHAWRMEGTFYFPLPADASLSRLAMYVANGKECVLMEGGMAERDYARQVFEQIMVTQRDPALLEWLDGSTFKMRVFPLEGRQEKRIILSYTQKLGSVYGRTAYRFPSGHTMQLVKDWSFEARVKGGAHLNWNCTSHQLKAAPANGDLVLTAQSRNVKPDRDVTLDIAEDPTMGPPARFSSAVHEGSQYLMLRYRPALPGQAQKQRRDWVFLFESGGDRDPLLARAQIEIIRTLLSNAEHDDTFAIVTAATRVKTLVPPQPVTAENVKTALESLEKVHLIGALDLAQAINHVRPLLQVGANPCLVHVGSGIAALGERKENALVKQLSAQVPYVGVGVGKRWSRNFMKAAAERSNGAFVQINPDEPVGWRAFELFSVLNAPRLHNVRVVDNAEKAVFLSHASSLAQGEELCAIARLDKGSKDLPTSVTISGLLDGQTFTENVPVAAVAPNADYLPRTWAKLEIDRLLAQDAEANKKKIVDLSKAMYVMTPFTSLLVLENEAMYKQFNVDRGRKDHWAMYDCPNKIPTVYEPDPSQGVDWRFAPRNVTPTSQKLPPETVLGTILVRMPPRFFAAPNQQGVQARTVLDLQQHAYAVEEFEDATAGSKGIEKSRALRESQQGLDPGLPKPGLAPPAAMGSGGRGTLRGGLGGGFGGGDVLAANAKAAALPQNFSAPVDRNRGEMNGLRRRAALEDGRALRRAEMQQTRGSNARRDEGVLSRMASLQDFTQLEQAGERKEAGKQLKKSAPEVAETIVSRLMTGHGYYSLIYQRPAFGGTSVSSATCSPTPRA